MIRNKTLYGRDRLLATSCESNITIYGKTVDLVHGVRQVYKFGRYEFDSPHDLTSVKSMIDSGVMDDQVYDLVIDLVEMLDHKSQLLDSAMNSIFSNNMKSARK